MTEKVAVIIPVHPPKKKLFSRVVKNIFGK